jgi:hypothetical protein
MTGALLTEHELAQTSSPVDRCWNAATAEYEIYDRLLYFEIIDRSFRMKLSTMPQPYRANSGQEVAHATSREVLAGAK